MYFSKAVSFIFIIFITRIIILNARYVKRNVARRAYMQHEYIEGWLKLKGRLLVNAKKAIEQQEVNSNSNKHFFGDLGSHPIATPRTLHAEDFTLPSPDMFTVSPTSERTAVTVATSRMQYHRPNFETTTRGDNREEETVTIKHRIDMEEVTHKTHQHPNQNSEEEMVTRKHDTDIEENTQKSYKSKNYQTNKHEKSENEIVTGKHSLDMEEVTHKSLQHANENGDEEMVTVKQDSNIEDDTHESSKIQHENESSDEEMITGKQSTDIEEVTHESHQHANENCEEETVTRRKDTDIEDVTRKNNKAKTQHGNENCEEEMVTRKNNIDNKPVPYKSYQHTNANGEEEVVTRKQNKKTNFEDVTQKCYPTKNQYATQKHEEEMITRKHDTNIEEATRKCNQRVNEDHEKEINTPKYDMSVEGVTHKWCRTKIQHTNENRGEEMTTRKHGFGTDGVSHETATEMSTVSYKPHECCKCAGEKSHEQYETNIERPYSKSHQTSKPYNDQKETAESAHRNQPATENIMEHKSTERRTEKIAETTTETNEEEDEEMEECIEENDEEAAITETAPEQTTSGSNKEKIVEETTCLPPFKFIILEPTFAKQLKSKVEQIKERTTTCGPDEEEVEETSYQTPFNNSTELSLATSKESSLKTTDNVPTTQTPVTAPSAPLVYQTMCFPVTERTNGTQVPITQTYQNVTLSPSTNGTHVDTIQAPQSSPCSITQPPVNGNQGYQTVLPVVTPPMNTTQGNETATTDKPTNVIQELTTPSFAVYAAMCFPVTNPTTLNTGITKSAPPLHAQKKRRLRTQRRQTVNDLFVMSRPSMRATLRRVVRELNEHENKAVDPTKMLTMVHYAGPPPYQRYYLSGLKGSMNSNNNHKKYENADYPEVEDGPKFIRGSKNIDLTDFEEGHEDEQSGIFEEAMKVKIPLCVTKAPPTSPSMAEKCLGKNHMSKTALPENERNPCADGTAVNRLPPVVIPIPQTDNDSHDGSCKQYGADESTLDANFSSDDLSRQNFGVSGDCGLGTPQLKKKTKAEISLENFRKAQANDPIQQKLSFMGRLLGRNLKLCDTNQLPNQLPSKSFGEKAKNVSMVQKIFEKWIQPKVSNDICHQKAKLQELLHHKNSIKSLNEANTKRRREQNRQPRKVKPRKSSEQKRVNTELYNRHANKRSKSGGDNKLSKAVEKEWHEEFMEHINPRRQSIMRRPRHIYTESKSHKTNWRDVDVPDLSFNWEGNVDVNDDSIF